MGWLLSDPSANTFVLISLPGHGLTISPCSALSHWQGTVFWRAVTARRMIWLQWRHINSWSCVVYGPWCGNLEEWMCQASAFVLYNLFWEKVARRAEVSALSIALIHCTSQWADDEFSVRCIQWSAGVFFSWESCEFCSQQGVGFFFLILISSPPLVM